MHSNYSFLCNSKNNEPLSGFDLQAGLSWTYPTNYPIRDYQFNIIQQALFQNTLVSLPTGLGKTFIASVVMYNFYRWYPTGKIIFMAPTKPLVTQQIDACYDIMAIPPETTAELTGQKSNQVRSSLWRQKRVFFATPQVLQNDLNYVEELGESIKCVVFDEAHRAKGNYSYCEVMRTLLRLNTSFRVLALSATPGSSIDDVGEVIKNLRISRLEFRTEESNDVKAYVFKRSVESIVVPLGDKLERIREEYVKILDRYVRVLINFKVVNGNCMDLTKGSIFMAKKEFLEKRSGNSNFNEIMKNLNICMTLYHAFELLIRHGLRSFLAFYEEHIDKPLLRGNPQLVALIENLREDLGPMPNVDQLPDGSYPEVPLTVKFGHPKYYKLRNILVDHFTSCDDNQNRVIVFFEYRESVMEAFVALLQARPLIRAKIFLGQSSGITQKVQLNVIRAFRDGVCNTLLSTCIGEEGLDVGEVGLIVCFDISNRSPIRMVQRMGRTGRKRAGKVVVLLTEGREQQTFLDCMTKKDHIARFILNSDRLKELYVESPRMVPEGIEPQCIKVHITVQNKKSFAKNIPQSKFVESTEDLEIREIVERIPETQYFWDKDLNNFNETDIKVYENCGNQRVIQSNGKIGASDSSKMFVDLLKMVEAKRFNIPLTQESVAVKNLKQGNIKNMFLRTASKNSLTSQDDNILLTLPSLPTSQNTETAKVEDMKILHLEISTYLAINFPKKKRSKIDLFNCFFSNFEANVNNVFVPSDNLYESITLKDLNAFSETFPKDELESKDTKLNERNDTVTFKPPKNLNKLLTKLNQSEIVSSQKSLDELLIFFKLMNLQELFNVDKTIMNSVIESIPSPDLSEKLSPILGSNVTKIKDSSLIAEDAEENLLTGIFQCTNNTSLNSRTVNLDLNDLCDLMDFGLNKISPDNDCEVIEVDAFKNIHNDSNDIVVIEDSLEEQRSPILSQNKTARRNLSTQYSVTQILNLVPDSLSKTQITTPDRNAEKKWNSTGPSKDDTKSYSSDDSDNSGRFNFSFNDKKISHDKVSIKSKPTGSRPAKVLFTSRTENDDDFEKNESRAKLRSRNVSSICPSVKKKHKRSNFLDDEAEVSDECSADESSGEDDVFEESFVNDMTQNNANTTETQAFYLRSLKSPRKTGAFIIPAERRPITSDIYSQLPDRDDENSYVNDSFCINTEQIEDDETELSQLEVLEMKLRNKSNAYKRKRIIQISDSDESD